jgi:hypothetical protein
MKTKKTKELDDTQKYRLYCRVLHDLIRVAYELDIKITTNMITTFSPKEISHFSVKLYDMQPFSIHINSEDITQEIVKFTRSLCNEMDKALNEYTSIVAKKVDGIGMSLGTVLRLTNMARELKANWLRGRLAEFVSGRR